MFPTDFSRCANQALAQALYLARKYQAELHALHVTVLPEGDRRTLTHSMVDTEEHNAQLKEMANQQMNVDLKSQQTDEVKLQQVYRRGISTAPEILLYAKELAAGYHARLQLLHVAEEVRFPQFYMSERISYFDLVPNVEAKSQQALQEFLHVALGPEVDADLHVVAGLAPYEIVKFAEHQACDLVVIATHGLTGLERMLHGIVTEKVVRIAPCPVLTVSAFGKSLL